MRLVGKVPDIEGAVESGEEGPLLQEAEMSHHVRVRKNREFLQIVEAEDTDLAIDSSCGNQGLIGGESHCAHSSDGMKGFLAEEISG